MATNRKVSFLLLFILCTFLVFYRLFSLWNSFLPDFHVFYFSAVDLLQSRNPYADTLLFTQLNYPIISLMPFLLLTFFPFYFASKIYIILNILALMGILFLSLKIVKQFSIRSFLAFLVLSLFFFPVSFTLGMGQVNLIAYFLLLLGIYLQEKFDFYPGILIALAIILKPIFIFLLIYFLLEKKWKTFGVITISLALFGLLNIKLFGISDYMYYINKQLPQLFNLQGREVYYNQGFSGFIARLTTNMYARQFFPLCFSIGTLLCLIFLKIKKIASKNLLSLFFISLLLIDSLSWQHHFVFLIFPFIALFFEIKNHNQKDVLYWLLGLSFLLTGMNIVNPNQFLQFPQSLLLSHVFWGTILLFALTVYTIKNMQFLQNRKISLFILIIFVMGILAQYLLFISCRGHICLR